jgi:flagellar basal-body rod modification protein FlgD
MITPISSAFSPHATSSSQTSSSSTSSTTAATENMFLQLLVAQLKNQDPTQPMDSTTFITQLAQIQQLQQSTATGEDVTGIRTDLNTIVSDLSGSSSS